MGGLRGRQMLNHCAIPVPAISLVYEQHSINQCHIFTKGDKNELGTVDQFLYEIGQFRGHFVVFI